MELIRCKYDCKKKLGGCVVTLGNFDGMHLGHQSLLRKLKFLGQKLHLPTVVIIFEPQPKEFFLKSQADSRLMQFREKWMAFREWKVDFLVCYRFNKILANLSPENFVKEILVDQLKVEALVVGDDCRFGAKRAGDYQLLKKLAECYGFEAIKMASILYEEERISSTRVRYALEMGNMDLARNLLGHFYWLCGKIISGEKRGRALGFPTANIDLHRDKVPLRGIFVIQAYLKEELFQGVASLGVRPTFGGTKMLLEVYLFNFCRDIYGNYLRVEFLHKLRSEEQFPSVHALVKQMRTDVSEAKDYFFKRMILSIS